MYIVITESIAPTIVATSVAAVSSAVSANQLQQRFGGVSPAPLRFLRWTLGTELIGDGYGWFIRVYTTENGDDLCMVYDIGSAMVYQINFMIYAADIQLVRVMYIYMYIYIFMELELGCTSK